MRERVLDNPRLAGAAYQLLEGVLVSQTGTIPSMPFEKNCISLLTKISEGYVAVANRPKDDSLCDPNIPALARVAVSMERCFLGSDDVTLAIRDAVRVSLLAGKRVWEREGGESPDAVYGSDPMQMLAGLFKGVNGLSHPDPDVSSVVFNFLDSSSITMFAEYLNSILDDSTLDIQYLRYVSEIVRCGQKLERRDLRNREIVVLVEALINVVSTRAERFSSAMVIELLYCIDGPGVSEPLINVMERERVQLGSKIRQALTRLRNNVESGSCNPSDLETLGNMFKVDLTWVLSSKGYLTPQQRDDIACFWDVAHMVNEINESQGGQTEEIRKKWIDGIIEGLNDSATFNIRAKQGFVGLHLLIALALHDGRWKTEEGGGRYFEPALVAAKKLIEVGRLTEARALVKWIPEEVKKEILSTAVDALLSLAH